MNRGRSATDWKRVEGQEFGSRQGSLSLSSRPGLLLGPLILMSNECEEIKRPEREAANPSPVRARVKNPWNFTFTPLGAFYVINHGGGGGTCFFLLLWLHEFSEGLQLVLRSDFVVICAG
jgi:hypothetical protein